MLWCTEIIWESLQTFWAHDEMVNVWPSRHAWALAALFKHPARSHHLDMDNLLSGEKNPTDLQILTKYFNLDITCVTCMKALHYWSCVHSILEGRAKSTKPANNFLSNYCAVTRVEQTWAQRLRAGVCDSPGPRCYHRCSSSCLTLWLLPSPPES